MSLINKTEDEWKTCLTPEQYDVLRRAGTEAAFTGKYYKNKETGMYVCAACGQELFSSETKFDSGTGWPSFTDPINKENVELKTDTSHGMVRTEVLCKNCGSHLGHVFDDGPNPPAGGRVGQRYCINSLSLDFKPHK
ncbi:MAG: peptide-methionine (R)-S-oxide reductase MsrB [bacterium]|nr:peptide-methionine (R)-S-oxide reductase MsrB [bacterium]